MKSLRFFCCLIIAWSILACKSDVNEPNPREKQKTDLSNGMEKLSGPYLGKEDKILEYLVLKEIPEDFPKHLSDETKKAYKERVFLWAKNNLELIKPEYRKKIKNRMKQDSMK